MKISNMIEEEDFENSYQEWSDKVQEIARKHSKKRKKRSPWKSHRLLARAKKNVQNELKSKLIPFNLRTVLLTRKRLIINHIINEDKLKHYRLVDRTIENIRMEGGVNSTAFYELRRRLVPKKQESAHAVVDQDGIRHDSAEEIKNEHVKYYKKLLSEAQEIEGTSAVNRVITGLELIAQNTETIKIEEDEVTKVIRKLKKRKAGDKEGWRNEHIIHGGEK